MSRRFTILSMVSLLLLLLWSVPDAFAQRVVNENGGFEDAEIGATTGIANWDLWLSAEDPPTVELEVVAGLGPLPEPFAPGSSRFQRSVGCSASTLSG